MTWSAIADVFGSLLVALCGGREHEPGCTSRRKKGIDCQRGHTLAEFQAVGYTDFTQADVEKENTL